MLNFPQLKVFDLQVIRTLDPKQNQGSGPEVQALKNQLQEKERMLLSLEVVRQSQQLAAEGLTSGPGGSCGGAGSPWTRTGTTGWGAHSLSHVSILPTERDGQDEEPEGLRGEADRVSVVQHGESLSPPTPHVPTELSVFHH